MKKKILKFSFVTLLVVLVAITGLLVYIKTALPNVGEAEKIKVEITEQRLERGKYLAEHVALCMDCHSKRDWTLFSAPPVAGTEGQGGEIFNEDMGFPGTYVAPNITPYNLKKWTDGELLRAISCGVSKDGNALFPIMPYSNYGKMDREDLLSIIAYIRSIDPIKNDTKSSSSNFPMNFIINTIPDKASFGKRPDPSNTISYGKYVTTTAGCYDCHTMQEKGEFVGEPFAGGFEFKMMDGSIVRAANITPHETGLKNWSKDAFVARFKAYADSSYVPQKVEKGEFQTVMPWIMYAGMTTEDLEAIYTYLQSVKAVKSKITTFSAKK